MGFVLRCVFLLSRLLLLCVRMLPTYRGLAPNSQIGVTAMGAGLRALRNLFSPLDVDCAAFDCGRRSWVVLCVCWS